MDSFHGKSFPFTLTAHVHSSIYTLLVKSTVMSCDVVVTQFSLWFDWRTTEPGPRKSHQPDRKVKGSLFRTFFRRKRSGQKLGLVAGHSTQEFAKTAGDNYLRLKLFVLPDVGCGSIIRLRSAGGPLIGNVSV